MRLHWGTAIALVYGAFAAATIGFVVFAAQHPVELVSEDYYASALRHDQQRAAVENAAALEGDVVSASADGRAVTVALPPDQVGDAAGAVRLYRPSDAGADRSLPLAFGADGVQVVSLGRLAAGRWIVQVAWTSGGRRFYRELPVMVR